MREIQAHLNRAGAQLEQDGIFGKQVERAVRQFQRDHSLAVDGLVGPNTMAALEQVDAPAPSSQDGEPKVVAAIRRLGHTVFEDGQINTIGVRSSNAKANSFDDEMHLAWVDGDAGWQSRCYACTCDPGTYYLEHPMKVEGTAILCPGQYPVYKFDKHRGSYVTLCQRAGPVKCWRDNTKDDILDHTGDPSTSWGINIHHALIDSSAVSKFSAGCQVFKRLEDWEESMSIWKKSGAELFTYTLINDTDMKETS